MKDPNPRCRVRNHDHEPRAWPEVDAESVARAAELFQAMGDGPRLRILQLLSQGELCVTEIVSAIGEKFSTVSQRLRILRDKRLVVRRREGTHLFYALADGHVADLIKNALAHADEWKEGASASKPSTE